MFVNFILHAIKAHAHRACTCRAAISSTFLSGIFNDIHISIITPDVEKITNSLVMGVLYKEGLFVLVYQCYPDQPTSAPI